MNDQQISEYLERFGGGLLNLRDILSQDAILRDMARQPLILSIMAMAFQSESIIIVQELFTVEKWRKYLFDTYIQQMFDRPLRTKNESYSPEETKYWLKWLAGKMLRRGETIFSLGSLRANWLGTYKQDLFVYLLLGIIVVICGYYNNVISSIEMVSSWAETNTLIFTVLFIKFYFSPPTTSALKWDWKASIIWALFFVLLLGLFGGYSQGLIFDIFAGLFVALLGGIAGGLKSRGMDLTAQPLEFRQVIKNAFIAWLYGGIAIALFNVSYDILNFYVLKLGLENGLLYNLKADLIIGGLLGGTFGLFYGGYVPAYHYFLRFWLYKSKCIPWKYKHFLDFASEHIFLRKVGVGYMFVHRLIMEHFANLDIMLQDNSD